VTEPIIVAVVVYAFGALKPGLIAFFALAPALFYLLRRGPGNSLNFVPFTVDKSTNKIERNERYFPFDDNSHFAYFAEKKNGLHVGGLVLIDGDDQAILLELDSVSANFLKDDLVLLTKYCNDWLTTSNEDLSAD
jgi:hypothetical protein